MYSVLGNVWIDCASKLALAASNRTNLSQLQPKTDINYGTNCATKNEVDNKMAKPTFCALLMHIHTQAPIFFLHLLFQRESCSSRGLNVEVYPHDQQTCWWGWKLRLPPRTSRLPQCQRTQVCCPMRWLLQSQKVDRTLARHTTT